MANLAMIVPFISVFIREFFPLFNNSIPKNLRVL
jgi:hypothetical protein